MSRSWPYSQYSPMQVLSKERAKVLAPTNAIPIGRFLHPTPPSLRRVASLILTTLTFMVLFLPTGTETGAGGKIKSAIPMRMAHSTGLGRRLQPTPRCRFRMNMVTSLDRVSLRRRLAHTISRLLQMGIIYFLSSSTARFPMRFL